MGREAEGAGEDSKRVSGLRAGGTVDRQEKRAQDRILKFSP